MVVSGRTGTLQVRDQLRDYQFRGYALEDMNFISFMLDTYETFSICEKVASAKGEGPSKGQPPHEQIPYLEGARKGKGMRVRRTMGHETLPRFVGRWFPQNNEPKTRQLYCASMLLLLSPWRSLQDLKDPMETFEESFERFIMTVAQDSKILRIIGNIQYYHDCYDAALARPKEDASTHPLDIDVEEEIQAELHQVDCLDTATHSKKPTEEEIEVARRARETDRERIYGERAIFLAKKAGIFDQTTERPNNNLDAIRPIARKADSATLDNLRLWNDYLTMATREQFKERGIVDLATIRPAEVAPMEADKVHPRKTTIKPGNVVNVGADKNKQRPLVAILNAEQRRAHDIIEETLRKELSGENSTLIPLPFFFSFFLKKKRHCDKKAMLTVMTEHR